MKNIFFIACFCFASFTISAQSADSVKRIKPVLVQKPNVAGTKKINPVNLNTKQVESTLNQIEAKIKELESLVEKLKDQKDSISEMNEQDQLQMQQVMEKKSQLEQMISNVLKKFSDTSKGIIQNMK